ncbi:MAG: DegT/DnrJ/EryC1/StrS aminotransferase family protein [Bacteroidia bacterium]|nr:DegT/DnrJ/EryC1/StrS aminotransferase family protein [Bacteroidia bacterium]MCZ2248865.1 DegT/DnrJ/EryC1/StrS aminotransferase family protein [Bacteroidia bacterium]
MIKFSPPHIDDKIIDEVVNTLKSGWITTGPRTKQLEKNIAAYCHVPNVLCLNSATAGLEIMLRWFGVGQGDEVIVPAYTYCATANVVMHCGAKPIFVDTNEDDFNINIERIKKAINSRTKVIMPVDFGGFPCDYDAINTLVKSAEVAKLFKANSPEQEKLNRILVLSDAAHSFGATYKGKVSGALCDATVFSFHAVKNLTTAEGGAIAFNLPEPFNNQEIYNYLCIKTLHGQNKDALAKTQKGNWKYDIIEPGYKCNMTDIAAAIGLIELSRYDSMILPKRKDICQQYSNAFSKYSWAQIPLLQNADKESSYHLYALRINNITEQQRDLIIQKIFDEDVSVNVHFIPVPMTSFYQSIGYSIYDYPVALKNFTCEISLPVYVDLSNEDINTVIMAVVKAVENVINN